MLRAVSTYVYVKERLHPGLLDELVKAGAQSIEIFAAASTLTTPTASSTSAKLPTGSRPPAFL